MVRVAVASPAAEFMVEGLVLDKPTMLAFGWALVRLFASEYMKTPAMVSA